MKYWHTATYKRNKWFKTKETDPLIVIEDYYRNNGYVYDADICGDAEIFFIFDNGEAYRLSYDWYIDFNPDWGIHNNYTISSIEPNSFNYPSNKDWIDV